jgi:hypothetical protein
MLPGSKRETFHLMLAARHRVRRGIDPPQAHTALERLPEQIAALTASRALISEESLAAATPKQVRDLLDRLVPLEVHLVVTVRDLARQVPSFWQQKLKNGEGFGFTEYVDAVVARTPEAQRFWRNQDLPVVLGIWRGGVPAERIHLVPVPPAGTPGDVLLHRFCAVVGVDPATLDTAVPRRNPSLGLAQAELLRRVNIELADEWKVRGIYPTLGKMYFARAVLGQQAGTPARLPVGRRDWCIGLAREYVAHAGASGYDVVGDLEDLIPADDTFAEDAQEVSEADVAAASTTALAAMLTERGRRIQRRRRRAAGRQARRLARSEPAPRRSLARRALGRLRRMLLRPR